MVANGISDESILGLRDGVCKYQSCTQYTLCHNLSVCSEAFQFVAEVYEFCKDIKMLT